MARGQPVSVEVSRARGQRSRIALGLPADAPLLDPIASAYVETLGGRVAVVTGAANGIGRSLAAAFGAHGCKVVLADLDGDALATATRELGDRGVEALAVPTDVSSWDSVRALADATESAFGAAHVLCNNAGIGGIGLATADLTIEDWTWTVGANLMGVVHGVQAFLPILLEQHEGHVVNTASAASFSGGSYNGPYCATKAAVLSLSESLSRELAEEGAPIGVTALCPGPVLTTISRSEERRPEHLRPTRVVAHTPENVAGFFVHQRTIGMSPDEVAPMVVDAVLANRFYVFPHRQMVVDAVRRRVDDVELGRNPAVFPLV
jgi:NAD(P)-dependent dehydrogenase (short-subunit alcohol dehydrogenase family)